MQFFKLGSRQCGCGCGSDGSYQGVEPTAFEGVIAELILWGKLISQPAPAAFLFCLSDLLFLQLYRSHRAAILDFNDIKLLAHNNISGHFSLLAVYKFEQIYMYWQGPTKNIILVQEMVSLCSKLLPGRNLQKLYGTVYIFSFPISQNICLFPGKWQV